MKERSQPLLSLFHLGLAIHHLNQKAEKKLDMSLGQWCVLGHLIDMPATSAHAHAKAVGVHPSTLTQALKRLETRGFVFMMEDPKDPRKKLISMTRIGKNAFDRAEQVFGEHAKKLGEMNTDMLALRERIAAALQLT